MNKQVDMQAFVGVDFDCEFALNQCSDFSLISPLIKVREPKTMYTKYYFSPDDGRDLLDREFKFCRPRLNKPQVLDDWSWLPDGLVWLVKLSGSDKDSRIKSHLRLDSFVLRELYASKVRNIEWCKCIGAEPDYKEWANAHGVPVVEVSK